MLLMRASIAFGAALLCASVAHAQTAAPPSSPGVPSAAEQALGAELMESVRSRVGMRAEIIALTAKAAACAPVSPPATGVNPAAALSHPPRTPMPLPGQGLPPPAPPGAPDASPPPPDAP